MSGVRPRRRRRAWIKRRHQCHACQRWFPRGTLDWSSNGPVNGPPVWVLYHCREGTACYEREVVRIRQWYEAKFGHPAGF